MYRGGVLATGARHLVACVYPLWFVMLAVTRPIRRALGLRSTRSLGPRGKRRFWQNLLVVGGLAALILWWVCSVFSRGQVPAGRGYCSSRVSSFPSSVPGLAGAIHIFPADADLP